MSCVCILTPVVIAAWPAFSAAVSAAAASLGYQVISAQTEALRNAREEKNRPRQIHVQVPNSNVVTDQLSRDQRITVRRDGVQIVFSRDARGKASLCVSGSGYEDDELRRLGEELSQRVVQHYVYQKLKEAMKTRHFMVVEEEMDETHAIRLKVRQWEA